VPVAGAGSAAPAAALRTVPDALVADCAGVPADWTSAGPAAGPETELAVSEEAVPAAERRVLLPEPELLVLDWVAPGAVLAVPDWLAPEPAEPVLDWLAPVPEEVFLVSVLLELALAAAGPECPVRACDAALTVEPTTELAVETGESTEVWAGPRAGGGSVAACACRMNTSMMKKIPAATIESCIAR
jgi:hypothetical protein